MARVTEPTAQEVTRRLAVAAGLPEWCVRPFAEQLVAIDMPTTEQLIAALEGTMPVTKQDKKREEAKRLAREEQDELDRVLGSRVRDIHARYLTGDVEAHECWPSVEALIAIEGTDG